jgi:hypothetical protein
LDGALSKSKILRNLKPNYQDFEILQGTTA